MSTPVASNTRYMRKVNAAAVLTELRRAKGKGVSVPELAHATGLSRQAVTRALSGLEKDGLVELLAPQRPVNRSGRPPQPVRFRAEAGHVLGVSITPDELHVAVADLNGTVVADRTTSAVHLDSAHVTELLTDTVVRTLSSAGLAPEHIWHASLGTPGIVSQDTREVRFTPSMPHITGNVLLHTLQKHLSCPIHLDNDVKLATEGERRREGHDRHKGPMVFVQWGERVGAGIVVFDRLYRGASNDAGDLGFLDLCVEETGGESQDPDLEGLGSFEAWVSSIRLIDLTRKSALRTEDHTLTQALENADEAVEVVAEVLRAGNPAATEALEEITRRFARGLGAVRALLDPEVVVIGGPMATLGEPLLKALTGHLEHRRLNPPRLELSTREGDGVVQGALHHSLAEVERDVLASPPTARFFS